MLWRALGHVKNGFYIDVGAQDPLIDSVSKTFYDQGWRGIHVEAAHAYANRLRSARPDELVVHAAVGKRHGTMAFYEFPDTGLSTGDKSIAQEHRSKGFRCEETRVPCITLTDVFADAGEREVHWLKIDVEGMEADVLAGWGKAPHRPWIMVVESTYPNSQICTHEAWEAKLLKRGYEFAYFDGLSRYYVSHAHAELAQRFGSPPNCFDDFHLAISTPYSALANQLLHKNAHEHVVEVTAVRERAAQELANIMGRLSVVENESAQRERRAEESARLASERKQRLAQVEQEATRREQHIAQLIQHVAEQERRAAEQLSTLQARGAQERMELQQAAFAEVERMRLHAAEQERWAAEQLFALDAKGAQDRKELQQAVLAEVERVRMHAAETERSAAEQLLALETRAAQDRKELQQAALAEVERVRMHAAETERWAAEQFLALETRAAQDRKDLQQAASSEIERARRDFEVRAQALAQQIESIQQNRDKLAALLAKREVESAEKLELVRSQSAEEKASLIRAHHELELRLNQRFAAREKESLAQKLEATLRSEEERAALLQVHQAEVRAIRAAASEREKLLVRQSIEAHEDGARRAAEQSRLHAEQHLVLLGALQTERAQTSRMQAELHAASQTCAKLREALVTTHQEVRRLGGVNSEFTESRATGTSWPVGTGEPVVARNIEDLLALRERKFVECAYRTLLGRAADPQGIDYYLGRLQSGFSKLQILAQLRLGAEGRAYAVDLPGLDAAVARERRRRLPLIGPVVRSFERARQGLTAKPRQELVPEQLQALAGDLAQVLLANTGDHPRVAQEGPVGSVLSRVKPADSRGAAAAPARADSQKGETRSQVEAIQLAQLAPAAREIYAQLDSALTTPEWGVI
jgi:FkbM family methyltransferase